MASICLKKFRGGVDAQRKIKEKRMEEEEEAAAEAEAAAAKSGTTERVIGGGGGEHIMFNFPQLPRRQLSNFPTK